MTIDNLRPITDEEMKQFQSDRLQYERVRKAHNRNGSLGVLALFQRGKISEDYLWFFIKFQLKYQPHETALAERLLALANGVLAPVKEFKPIKARRRLTPEENAQRESKRQNTIFTKSFAAFDASREQAKATFERMTEADHAAMKARLIALDHDGESLYLGGLEQHALSNYAQSDERFAQLQERFKKRWIAEAIKRDKRAGAANKRRQRAR